MIPTLQKSQITAINLAIDDAFHKNVWDDPDALFDICMGAIFEINAEQSPTEKINSALISQDIIEYWRIGLQHENELKHRYACLLDFSQTTDRRSKRPERR